MTYDPSNIFAKILRKELPCKAIFENEHVLAFHDLYPKAPVHILVIPKGSYMHYADFCANASAEEIVSYFKAIEQIAKAQGLDQNGYRLISNCGEHAHQEVPHFHTHLCGGKLLKSPF